MTLSATKNVLRMLMICAVAVSFGATQAHANVYASQLAITDPDGSEFDGRFNDGTGALLSFTLNDDATSVVVRIREEASGDVVHEIDMGALERGRRSAEWDGTGAETGASYVFEVTAEQENRSTEEWTIFFDTGDIDIFTRGASVVRNPESPRFGMLFATNTGGPLGKGLTLYEPDGSFSEPFLVADDVDWGSGSDSMFSGLLDDEDRYYVSAVDAGEVRRINTDFSVTTVVSGLTNPKDLWMVGSGADRVLYISDDNRVVRAAIGDEDVFSGELEVVAEFADSFPRALAIDDGGNLYVGLRESNSFGSDPVALEKYDLSGDLPVTGGTSAWSLSPDVTFRVADLLIDNGADRTTADDDILYFSTRAGSGTDADGVWRVDGIDSAFPTVEQLISDVDLYGSDGSNINDRAAIVFDPAGNIVLMENSNEHIFFLSPPGEGTTNSFVTTSAASFTVVSVSREREELPSAYRLEQNYPNPFNPITTVSYTLGRDGFTTVRVYDTLGRAIRTLTEAYQTEGTYQVSWDATDDVGRALGSGIYILSLTSGDFQQSIRMTLLK